MNSEDQSHGASESDPISDSSLELRSIHQAIHGQVSGLSVNKKRPVSITKSNGSFNGFMGVRKDRTQKLRDKARHLRKYYSDSYRELLNEEISNATKKTIWDRGESVLDSEQIGLSIWSTSEKTRFFDSLARLGVHDLRGISAHVETKSEPEVYTFIQLLRESTVDQAIQVNWKLLTQDELPAAVEIGAECCEALDHAAEALELFHRYNEEEDEAAQRGDFWLLTTEEASWVGERVREGISGLKMLEDKLPEAALLDLESFLQLSETVFMNGDPISGKENWRLHAEDGETPSIRLAAFEDLYQLTVNITRRLVQTVIFHTLSRVRAMDSTSFKPKPEVRIGDVHAAVQSLGMKHDSRDFWKRAARRNGLLVTETKVISKKESEVIPYDVIEQRLSLDNEDTKRKQTQEDHLPFSLESMDIDRVPSTHGPNPTDGAQVSISDSEYLTDPDDNNNRSSSATRSSSPTSSSTNSLSTSYEKNQEALEDAYVDALDRVASQAEEERLWQILDQEPSNPQIKISLPAQPRFARQPAHERKKWWEGFEYRPEWEVLASQRKHSVNHGESLEPAAAAAHHIPRQGKSRVQRPIELDRDDDEDEDDNNNNNDGSGAEVLVKRTQEAAAAAAPDEDLYDVSSDEIMQDVEGSEEG